MHTEKTDPQAESALPRDEVHDLTLVIGNKNYSSWSMRPWVAMKAFDIPFREIRILLDRSDTSASIARYSAAGRVPILLAGDITVWDSLAICEFLAEQFPGKNLWPRDARARATARAICAEMHGGFGDLRSAMSMNIRASFPGKGQTPGAQSDIARISEIWESCLDRFGRQAYLFGEFSLADAYYAPVVMRFRTYAVSLTPALDAYMARVAAHPAVTQWMAEAVAETEVSPKYDACPD
jgi:glutathione S-transferase